MKTLDQSSVNIIFYFISNVTDEKYYKTMGKKLKQVHKNPQDQSSLIENVPEIHVQMNITLNRVE